jgi:hypothetical protein
MVHELGEFIKINEERAKLEFFIQPVIYDSKYGHVNSLQWICSRWFCDCKSKEELPEWYSAMCDEINLCKSTLCFDVATHILSILKRGRKGQRCLEKQDPQP